MRLCEETAQQIDLLVTDIIMPDMDGRDLAQKLHLRFPGLKVLFVSGYNVEVLRRRGGFSSSEAFLSKPFGVADFAQKVRHVLDGKPLASPQ